MNNVAVQSIDEYLKTKTDDWGYFFGDARGIIDVIEGYQEVTYDNFNTVRFDGDKKLGFSRMRSIYAENKEAWLLGRVEFLERALKDAVGDEVHREKFAEVD